MVTGRERHSYGWCELPERRHAARSPGTSDVLSLALPAPMHQTRIDEPVDVVLIRMHPSLIAHDPAEAPYHNTNPTK